MPSELSSELSSEPTKRLRPVDLGREHGLSAQAVRNYEQDGFLPTAERTPTGYRIYTELHAAALRTFLALVRAYGHAPAGAVMNAVHAGRTDDALTALDHGHAQLLRDRETLASVRGAVEHLAETAEAAEPAPDPGPLALSIGEVAHRLGLTPATLRTWEAAGILLPQRDRATGHRVFRATDVRDAELAHLLRRGGYRLPHIAAVVQQIRTAGGTSALAAALADWQERLTARGLAMLSAAAHLSAYLTAAAGSDR
ncbi:TioE family transcriptional regulator [Kitasatospora purpeofusca]|uniref:TioE family transcriptional regulator n=1 Tax=Kitasatospora purpeofusca TaxID=67352 RepID=UPI00386CC57B|nr:TioE family transcriptional regulator [Kitasatospora purpeofusca]